MNNSNSLRGRPRSNKKRICISLQPALENKLKRRAHALGIDRSALIAIACAFYLDANKINHVSRHEQQQSFAIL